MRLFVSGYPYKHKCPPPPGLQPLGLQADPLRPYKPPNWRHPRHPRLPSLYGQIPWNGLTSEIYFSKTYWAFHISFHVPSQVISMHSCEWPSPLLNFLDHIQFPHCWRYFAHCCWYSPTVGDISPTVVDIPTVADTFTSVIILGYM